MLDSQQAWLEYVPARVTFDLDSSDPWQRLKYYRHIQFGNLVDLFMLDGRTYRSPHPCGENLALGRYAPLFCLDWQTDTSQTMLGAEQFSWLVNGLEASKSKWQLLGNQTFMAPIWFGFFAKPGADPYSLIRMITVIQRLNLPKIIAIGNVMPLIKILMMGCKHRLCSSIIVSSQAIICCRIYLRFLRVI